MHPKKTYFLAPTRDQPPNGAIALGNLIKSPRTPDFPLNDANSPTIKRLRSAAIITPELDATRSLSTKLSLQPSIFTSFLSGLLGDLELGLDLTKEATAHYKIPRLETHTINPLLADVRALFAEPDVQAALRDSRFTANLYLITGVQIAYGAEYVVARARERGAHVHLAADVTAAMGVPVGVGVGTEVVASNEGRAAGRVEGPFVFAYSLREVLYRRKMVTGQRRVKVEGDLFADFEGGKSKGVVAVVEGDQEEGEGVKFQAELAGLKEDDPELPEHWDLAVEGGLGLDGAECQIVRVDAGENGDDDDDSVY
ncbi:hypothetical protein C8A03DRAFT_17238 [Achaetomium macrosporum]|uniref:Uncharacterized protein n=1 Tax=Achaetomium macrosporum TaxID=79813 RepID=A0AAN7C6Z7_9PEZI|nr:hypothetical protein C8A03DRAFT_17238 [Achaetomium macrosporum]